MLTFLTFIYILVCLFLIIVVLLQSGKAADLAGAFGGMGSQTAFGPRGAATVLSKATTIAAIIFMVGSIWLGIEHARQAGHGDSVIERTGADQAAPVPEAPATESTLPGGIQTKTSTIQTEPASQPEDEKATETPAAESTGTTNP